jgi:hypothetical protein
MNNKIIYFLALALTIQVNLFAQAVNNSNSELTGARLNAITTSLPFMSITPDSRSGAMGDVGTAISPTSHSIYWNTANLINAKKKSEISVSYTPWLRQLANDIHLSYVSAYSKLGSRHAITGALRYFSLGEITFTDNTGAVIRHDKPNEFEITGGYAFKLSERLSIGLNGKFANSNLTGGAPIPGAETKAGIVGASDLSFMYHNPAFNLGTSKGSLSLGATINNIGNKVAYSNSEKRDFIPMNLKLGGAYLREIDNYNSVTFALDLSRLLVPTPPIRSSDQTILSGKNDDIGIVSAMLQSFYDAPGELAIDANGDVLFDADGNASVVKNSILKEELREIMIATGIEYWYNETFALRTGFFYEHVSKGARQYFNAGVGLKYNIIGIDISYLLALKRNNPLANTLRFTLRFDIGAKSDDTPATPL